MMEIIPCIQFPVGRVASAQLGGPRWLIGQGGIRFISENLIIVPATGGKACRRAILLYLFATVFDGYLVNTSVKPAFTSERAITIILKESETLRASRVDPITAPYLEANTPSILDRLVNQTREPGRSV
jgi:hypothetical protein